MAKLFRKKKVDKAKKDSKGAKIRTSGYPNDDKDKDTVSPGEINDDEDEDYYKEDAKDEDDEKDAPPGKFRGPTTINGEGTMDAGETDGTADIPEEYRDANGDFKMMPVPRHLGSLTRRRPPLALIVGLSGAGKSRLAAALMGKSKKESYRVVFRVGKKTTVPHMVAGEKLAVLDTPGLPDPYPQSSDEYYNATVSKLRQVGYANAVLFVLNQDKVTPTFIKNYGILYRALHKLPCVKMFVCRRKHSFVFQNVADQAVEEAETRKMVNDILAAANLKKWKTQQFFMLTNGSGEEQDKQLKYIREEVKSAPRVDIQPGEGLLLTSERAQYKADEAAAKAKADAEAAGARGSWRKNKKWDAVSPADGAEPTKTPPTAPVETPAKTSSGCTVM